MLGNYFYHQIIRKTVIAFGTLFNDIHVRHDDGAGNVISDIKVPVAYGPRQKFLARVTQQAELNKATQITLPRMSFEITNIFKSNPRLYGTGIKTFFIWSLLTSFALNVCVIPAFLAES